jgi:hypothetical protein
MLYVESMPVCAQHKSYITVHHTQRSHTNDKTVHHKATLPQEENQARDAFVAHVTIPVEHEQPPALGNKSMHGHQTSYHRLPVHIDSRVIKKWRTGPLLGRQGDAS